MDARLASDCGLTLGRYEVLSVVGHDGPCRVNDISQRLAITWGGTSKLVDRLEAARLCKRRPNPDDGRSSLIELTTAGERALGKATDVVQSELEQCVGGLLPPQSVKRLAGALHQLNQSGLTRGTERRTA